MARSLKLLAGGSVSGTFSGTAFSVETTRASATARTGRPKVKKFSLRVRSPAAPTPWALIWMRSMAKRSDRNGVPFLAGRALRWALSAQQPLKFMYRPPRSGGESATARLRLTLVAAAPNVKACDSPLGWHGEPVDERA